MRSDDRNARNRRYRAANRQKVQQWERRSRIRKGLIPAPTRPEPQLCECCGNPPSDNRALAIDHDHVTGAFRGWLCVKCNSGIGLLGDTVDSVRRAAAYLERNAP